MAERPPAAVHGVVPFLSVSGAAELLDFVVDVLGGTVTERILRADGSVGHGEVAIGPTLLMVSEATERFPARTSALYAYVPDVDDTYARAIALGATSVREPTDQVYGNREAGVVDRWGILWWIATAVEDVPPDEIQRRLDAADRIGSG